MLRSRLTALAQPALLLLLGSTLASCVGPWPTKELKAGFIYVGPVVDHGWTLTHDVSRLYLEEELGIETQFADSVLPADASARMEEFIAAGDNVIVTTSFDFLSATTEVAGNHPDVNFLNCSGFTATPNMGSYFGRMYQIYYLVGRLAAQYSCTEKIGLVGSITIPETVRHINALTLGARSVNPDIVVQVEWVGAWFAPEAEGNAAAQLIADGADIIMGGTDTFTPLSVADAWDGDGDGQNLGFTDCRYDESGDLIPDDGVRSVPIYSFGYDNDDTCDFAVNNPNNCLASAYWNWGPLLKDIMQDMEEFTWETQELRWDQVRNDSSESVAALSDMSPIVPASVQNGINEIALNLTDASNPDAKILPFHGPISDKCGESRVQSGEVMTDDDLLKMYWYVEGVVSRVDGADVPGVVPTGCGGEYYATSCN